MFPMSRAEKSKSCGCESRAKIAAARTIHGDNRRGHRTAEYRIWRHMKSRCLNPKVPCFKYYGGRGIRVCIRWLNSFPNFLADMGRRPSPDLSIERKNNDGNYTPKNCKWATRSEQNKNRQTIQKEKTLCLIKHFKKSGIKRRSDFRFRCN